MNGLLTFDAFFEKFPTLQGNVPFLFPIALDQTIFQFDEQWVHRLRQAHPISDLSLHATPEAYEQACGRILNVYKSGL